MLTETSSRSVLVSWDLPLPENRNGEISGYTVTVQKTDTGETSHLSAIETSLTVQSLTPYNTYQFSVAASTSIGRGPFTSTISVTTLEDGKLL